MLLRQVKTRILRASLGEVSQGRVRHMVTMVTMVTIIIQDKVALVRHLKTLTTQASVIWLVVALDRPML